MGAMMASAAKLAKSIDRIKRWRNKFYLPWRVQWLAS